MPPQRRWFNAICRLLIILILFFWQFYCKCFYLPRETPPFILQAWLGKKRWGFLFNNTIFSVYSGKHAVQNINEVRSIFSSVLWIRDILVPTDPDPRIRTTDFRIRDRLRIRILLFRQWLSRNKLFFKVFLLIYVSPVQYYFLKVHFHQFS